MKGSNSTGVVADKPQGEASARAPPNRKTGDHVTLTDSARSLQQDRRGCRQDAGRERIESGRREASHQFRDLPDRRRSRRRQIAELRTRTQISPWIRMRRRLEDVLDREIEARAFVGGDVGRGADRPGRRLAHGGGAKSRRENSNSRPPRETRSRAPSLVRFAGGSRAWVDGRPTLARLDGAHGRLPQCRTKSTATSSMSGSIKFAS